MSDDMDLKALFYAVGQLDDKGTLSPMVKQRIETQLEKFHAELRDEDTSEYTQQIKVIKKHMKTALGHKYFELHQLDQKEREERTEIDVEIDVVFSGDDSLRKRFELAERQVIGVYDLDYTENKDSKTGEGETQ